MLLATIGEVFLFYSSRLAVLLAGGRRSLGSFRLSPFELPPRPSNEVSEEFGHATGELASPSSVSGQLAFLPTLDIIESDFIL